MQIVIDIPEKIYKAIQDNTYCGISNSDMYDAIRNGTPLPKGHGRLIDGDVLKNQNCCSESYVKLFTIVEADEEKDE